MEQLAMVALLIMVLVYLGVKLFRPAIRMKEPKLGVPGAQVIYSDEEDHTLLVSEKYDLQGKPDYIFQTLLGGSYIPVELKSTQLKKDEDSPHEGDLMQLVAYFLIIEDVYGKKPKQGRLIYKNRMFIVKNTRSLRRQIKHYLKDMRKMLKTGQGQALPSFPKCRNCVSRETVCEWYEG